MAEARAGGDGVRAEERPEQAPQFVVLQPWLSERIWGATELPDFLEQPKLGHPVGEAWLTAVDCKVEGRDEATLGELTRRWPQAFGADEPGEFPLLIKFLFPHEWLSVQVHPNDAEAQAIGQPRGKNECWYVLSAEPGAKLALGFEGEITTGEMERAIREGTLESRLRYVPVKAGDMVYVEAGTIHAIGPGMVVLETQQYSDTTYRLYDYGRPRELHLKDGLAVTKTRTEAGLVAPVEMDGFTRLISTQYFVVDRFKLEAGAGRELGLVGQMQILIALSRGAALHAADRSKFAVPAGHALVLPGRDNGEFVLEGESDVEVIRISTGIR
ncbi:MAG TPA: type I phosphomannose isomerase catalytic subunit [Candidatus Aquilonibacter sp.]|nr:type I phosphomannose isomerase catalytic subunit [Candidatus Aquilonibacter sp.]